MKSRFKTARRLLIFWTLFIGLGAVAGASGRSARYYSYRIQKHLLPERKVQQHNRRKAAAI